jgi:hypothetical protein
MDSLVLAQEGKARNISRERLQKCNYLSLMQAWELE